MLKAKRIAVVGLSDDPSRPSHEVAQLSPIRRQRDHSGQSDSSTVMGLKCYSSLEEVPGDIDLVEVFRRAEFCPDVVRSAVKVGAKGVWLQSGIVSPEAEQIAREAGIDFVQDRCLKVDLMFGGSR